MYLNTGPAKGAFFDLKCVEVVRMQRRVPNHRATLVQMINHFSWRNISMARIVGTLKRTLSEVALPGSNEQTSFTSFLVLKLHLVMCIASSLIDEIIFWSGEEVRLMPRVQMGRVVVQNESGMVVVVDIKVVIAAGWILARFETMITPLQLFELATLKMFGISFRRFLRPATRIGTSPSRTFLGQKLDHRSLSLRSLGYPMLAHSFQPLRIVHPRILRSQSTRGCSSSSTSHISWMGIRL